MIMEEDGLMVGALIGVKALAGKEGKGYGIF